MPTATATMTHNDENGRAAFRSVVLPSKSSNVVGSAVGVKNDVVVGGGVIGATTAATTITLRTLYNRATRSFLHRDVKLTCQLLETAFSIIQPPNPTPSSSKSITNSNSSLQLQEISTDEKRKWDILRITLESTVYASTLTPMEQSSLPESLRLVLQETPNDLVKGFYERSLELFSTSRTNDVGVVAQNGSTNGGGMDGYSRRGDVAFFPTQVLITLVLASLKVGCPDFGRIMIEDWLSKREQPSSSSSYGERSGIEVDGEDGDGDGYAKVLEIYCLHVLPKLSQWEYAVEFLEYESELGVRNRERLSAQLKSAYTNYLTSLRKSSSPSTTTTTSSSSHSESSTPRPHSPATSTSSSSSSLSTTSTHTIVPTHRQGVNGHSNMNGHGYGRSHSRSSSSGSSTKSDVTARARPNGTKMNGSNDETGGSKLTNMNGNGNGIRSRSKSKARAKARTASSGSGNGNGNGQLRSKSKSKANGNGNVHVGAQMLNGHGLGQGLGGGGGNSTSSSSSSSGSGSAMTRSRLSNFELVKVVIKPYLTKGKLLMAFLVFVVLPILSLVVRRRRRKSGGGVSIINTTMNSEVSNVELVRRRLGGVEAGLAGKAWNEVVRVVLDTVKMAGSGLV